jgi:hemolysin activation/secretion protein
LYLWKGRISVVREAKLQQLIGKLTRSGNREFDTSVMTTTTMKLSNLCGWLVAGLCFSLLAWGEETPSAVEAAPAVQMPAQQAVPEAQPAFAALEFQVEGNSVLKVEDVEKAVYPFMGEGKTIQDVEQAREALEKAYRDAGFMTVFVDIPEQSVDSGVIRLRVTEGRVERTRVTGSHYYSLGRIRSGVPSLAEGAVPNFNQVQEEIAALNRTPGRAVTPVLKAGRSPGTVDIELKVNDSSPFHASLELTDRYSANTSRTRLTGMLRYDNLWQREHSLNLQYQTSPEDTNEVKVLSGTYVAPLTNSGIMLALYAVRSDSNISVVGDTTVLGKGDIYGVRAIVPLPSVQNFSHSLTLGADYKDFEEELGFGGGSIQTPIRYMPFTLQYSASLPDSSGATQFGLGANFAFRGLLSRTMECVPGDFQDQFECKRHGAKSNYLYLRGNLERKQNLFSGLSLRAGLEGQVTDQPLISNEQFSLGGAESVRGYKESDSTGDMGVRAYLEFISPSLAKYMGDKVQDLRVLAFYEQGRLRVIDPLPGQTARFNLASAGLGVRLKGFERLTAELDIAHALRETASTPDNETRTHFRLMYEF